MTDNSFENARFGKSPLEKGSGRGQLGHIVGVAQAIGYPRRGHDNGRKTAEFLIAHAFKTFVAIKGHMVFVSLKGE